MESIIEVVKGILNNKESILEAIALIIAGATVLVRLIPNLKSGNKFLGILKFIAKYVALNRNAPAERPQ